MEGGNRRKKHWKKQCSMEVYQHITSEKCIFYKKKHTHISYAWGKQMITAYDVQCCQIYYIACALHKS
jgi:hypothetical protein